MNEAIGFSSFNGGMGGSAGKEVNTENVIPEVCARLEEM
jgi:hypothetical protein